MEGRYTRIRSDPLWWLPCFVEQINIVIPVLTGDKETKELTAIVEAGTARMLSSMEEFLRKRYSKSTMDYIGFVLSRKDERE